MKHLLIIFLCLAASLANAQDIFQKNLYSADKVMELRTKLNLTEVQATKIKKIHSDNAGKFSTEKWDLDEETSKLKTMLDQSKIDQAAVQKQMDKVLALENSLKKRQLSTMVAIKNELSLEQQTILQSITNQSLKEVKVIGYSTNSNNSPLVVQGYPAGGTAKTGGSSSPKLSVRVAGTSAADQPIYMMDTKNGMKPITNLNEIDPQNIESIKVLKDKLAIESFGEKGKNGVIIVKLKDEHRY